MRVSCQASSPAPWPLGLGEPGPGVVRLRALPPGLQAKEPRLVGAEGKKIKICCAFKLRIAKVLEAKGLVLELGCASFVKFYPVPPARGSVPCTSDGCTSRHARVNQQQSERGACFSVRSLNFMLFTLM